MSNNYIGLTAQLEELHTALDNENNPEMRAEIQCSIAEVKEEIATCDKVLDATYLSVWEEGEVSTSCQINIQTMVLESIESGDQGENFEHLVSECVQVEINGTVLELKATQGELTDQSQDALHKALS